MYDRVYVSNKSIQNPISISGFLVEEFSLFILYDPPAAGSDPAAFLFAQLSGKTQLVEENRVTDQGEDNPITKACWPTEGSERSDRG
jgi:hypothetical protein